MVTRSPPARGLLPILLFAWVCWAPQPAAAEPPGVLVHLFEWPWADVALECERVLGPAGIAGVQVSPPNEHRLVPGRPWWERYQPVSYQLISRGGDRAAFADMVDRCRAAGVGIHVDAIINHTTGPRFADDPLWGTGSAGSSYDYYRYPDYGPEDFHPCREPIGDNYQDRDRVQGCNLVSLADLDTGSERVRATLATYLNDLVGLGVAGFRIDAAKHIAAADLSAILERVQGDPLIYQEVIEAQGEPIQGAEYFPYGLVTEFDYGKRLAEHFHNANLAGLRGLGPAWQELMPSDRALVFVDNHDKQRGHGGGGDYLTHKEPGLYTLANVFMLAWPYGTPKLMSSYHFEHGDQGPPNDQGATRPIYREEGGDRCGDDWVCEHRWGPIQRMVGFRAATQGAPQVVDHWWDNGGNQIAFGRGGLGFVVINRGERPLEERLQTGLPAGDYCNLWEGGLAAGACEGGAIRVAADGGALFTVPPMAAAMIQVQARPEPTPGDWRRTLIFIRGETQPGQDLFVRGGIDHGHASTLGRDCTPQNLACALPIRHRNLRNSTTSGWKQGDEHLDWYGAEPGQQPSASGEAAEGTPLDWTTDAWPADWGARRTVAEDGFGEEPLNTWGHHYWMLDADLDCSRTLDGWFEVKSYIAKGPGWEPDITQPGAPWQSGNHFARCGWLNVFARGQAEAIEQREPASE